MILKELFVKLGLDVDAQSFLKGQITADAITAVFSRLAHTLAENIKGAVEYGDRIEKTSQKIGIARKALQELQYAGSLADLSAEDMSSSIGLLSKKMEAARKGGGETAAAFKDIKFLDGKNLLPTDEVLGEIADKFASMPDGAEKTALAMQLFGRGGKQMIPLLNKGREELEGMRKEAQDLGLVMDDESVKASEELNDNIHRLSATTQGLWRHAIGPLIPHISELVKRFLAWRKENALVIKQRIEKWAGTLAKGIDMLSDTLTFLVDNATAVKMVMLGMIATMAVMKASAVATAAAWIAAWAPVIAPFAAIAAAIAAFMYIADDIRVYVKGGKSVLGEIEKGLTDWMKPKPGDSWFVSAIKDFVGYIRDAIRYIKEFDALISGKSTGPAVSNALSSNAFSPQWKKDKLMQMGPLTKVEEIQRKKDSGQTLTGAEWMTLNKATEQGIDPYARARGGMTIPEVRAPAGSRVGGNVNAPVTINVTQQPGESGPNLAQMIVNIAKGQLQDALQAAAAGVKP